LSSRAGSTERIATAPEIARRSGPLGALCVATGISLVGNQLTALALPWLVLTTLGPPIDAGIVGAAIVLPAVFGALAGGVVIDRFGPRRTSVVADVLSGAAVVAVPIAAMTVGLGLALVVVLAFLGALLDAPGQTARQVLLPDLAAAARVRLERANATFQAIENGSLLVGPAIAGVIVLAVGPLGALWLDAVSFLVSAVLIRLLVPDIRPAADDGPADIGAGIRALASDPVLRMLTVVAAIANLVFTPLFIVVLPALATRSGESPAALGAMLAVLGAGMVVGALGIGLLAGRVRRRTVLIIGFVGTGAALIVASVAVPLPALLVALGVAGVASGLINPIAFTVMQERVPAATRGRVFGAVLGGVLVAAPVGMVALGAIADVAGPRTALWISGVTIVAIGGLVAILRASRELDAAPQPA
jgi:MFS family permease